MNLKTHNIAWKNMTQEEVWASFTCPGRPSRDDIRNFNLLVSQAIRGKKNPDILVMGCTPEVRDMLQKYSLLQGAKIICVDMTEKTYQAMSRLTKNDNRQNEKFILANWVDMNFGKKFDVIIGDYVIGNMDMTVREKILQNIANHLKPRGVFIERDYLSGKNIPIKTVAQLFKKYSEKLKKEELTYQEAANWLVNELLIFSWKKHKDFIVSMSAWEKEFLDFGKNINKFFPKDKYFIKDFYDYCHKIFFLYSGKYWTAVPEKDNLKMLNKYFRVNKRLYSRDYDKSIVKCSPIYSLSKK